MPTTTRSAIKQLLSLSAVAAVSLTAAAQAPDYTQSQPAPIQRSAPAGPPQNYRQPARPAVKTSQPAPGVWLRVSPQGSVTTVSATADHTELRVDSGIANITVHHPAHDALILVDLGGGQVDLIKDGLYTFNAATRTVRVLVGEAEAFNGTDANSNGKPIKVKEDHALTFGTANLRTVEFAPFQARPDLLPGDTAYAHGDGPARPGPYGYGFYGGYPYGGYPYYAWDYPYYGWEYPYGFGFGYYGGFGGFYGGGFRGGFGGGFGRGRR
jgi:hypothetical protein